MTHDPVAAPPELARTLVLLVEDEEPLRRLMTITLSRQGWRILAAESAEAALVAIDGAGVAMAALRVIVTDLTLPGMDGLDLIRAARVALARPDLPAVVISGYANATQGHALLQDGTVRFLTKPFPMTVLAKAVDSA